MSGPSLDGGAGERADSDDSDEERREAEDGIPRPWKVPAAERLPPPAPPRPILGWVREGRDLSLDVVEQCDVIVVGSGCGGASLAARLQAAGKQVVLLEQGARWSAARGELTMREAQMYERLYARGGVLGAAPSSSVLWGETLGGGSVQYLANSFRAPERRLALWAERYGLGGLSPSAMAPWYAEVEALHSVHEATDDELNRNNRLFKLGTEKLGWKGQPTRHARKLCTGQGVCLLGCPLDRKQSQTITNLPVAIERGAHIYTDCRVDRIVVENGRAVGVEAVFHDGSPRRLARARLTVRGALVVLAGGGVGTPAMLLRQGLANSSGQVGRNLQVTPHYLTVGDFDERVAGWEGVPTSWVLHQFAEVRGDEGGFQIQGVFAQPGLLASLLPGFGAAHRARMERLPHLAALHSLVDDEEPGQVRVDGGRTVVDYRLRGRDVAKARDYFRKAARILLAAGARRVLLPDQRRTSIAGDGELARIEQLDFAPGAIAFSATSAVGTCRMGADAARSVVSPSGETHDVRRLFIVDASALPTSTAVDPSLTIMANALRVADGILHRWSELG